MLSSSCVTTLGGGFSQPSGVAVDGSGNVYVADHGNSAVKEMPPGCASSSCVTTLGGGFSQPYGVAVDGERQRLCRRNLRQQPGEGDARRAVLPPVASRRWAAASTFPPVWPWTGSGNVYVADCDNNAVKELPLAMPAQPELRHCQHGHAKQRQPKDGDAAQHRQRRLSSSRFRAPARIPASPPASPWTQRRPAPRF